MRTSQSSRTSSPTTSFNTSTQAASHPALDPPKSRPCRRARHAGGIGFISSRANRTGHAGRPRGPALHHFSLHWAMLCSDSSFLGTPVALLRVTYQGYVACYETHGIQRNLSSHFPMGAPVWSSGDLWGRETPGASRASPERRERSRLRNAFERAYWWILVLRLIASVLSAMAARVFFVPCASRWATCARERMMNQEIVLIR